MLKCEAKDTVKEVLGSIRSDVEELHRKQELPRCIVHESKLTAAEQSLKRVLDEQTNRQTDR